MRLDVRAAAAQVALLTGISAAPWVMKPLYGFLSDTVPIFGYRRRSYLIICGILGARLFPAARRKKCGRAVHAKHMHAFQCTPMQLCLVHMQLGSSTWPDAVRASSLASACASVLRTNARRTSLPNYIWVSGGSLRAGAVSWAAMAGAVRSPAGAVAATLLGSLGTACSDVVVDSIVVERSRGQPQARP